MKDGTTALTATPVFSSSLQMIMVIHIWAEWRIMLALHISFATASRGKHLILLAITRKKAQ
jgi:hypothetical protein